MRFGPSRRRAILLLSLLITLPGCAGRHHAPATGSLGDVPEGWAPTMAEREWSALYRGSFRRGTEERGFRMALAYATPDRFRLEFFGAVGGTRLLVASDGEVLAAAFPGDRIVGRGRAGPAALRRLLGIPLPGRDLVALLAGEPEGGAPSETGARRAELAGGGEMAAHWRLDDAGRIDVVELEVRDEEGEVVRFRVAYRDYRDGPSGVRPHEVRISREDRLVVLRLREAAPRSFPEDTFTVPVPAGFEVVALEGLGGGGALLLGGDG